MPIIYDDLKPLTILDPLLLYGFMYICPKKELPGLFAKVHPYFSMALLSKLVRDNRRTNLEEVTWSGHSIMKLSPRLFLLTPLSSVWLQDMIYLTVC